MMNLQVAKWGNSLAVRIPADYVRQIGVKEGDQLQAHLGADGALNLRAANWSRKSFAQDLASVNQALPMGTSVMDQLRSEHAIDGLRRYQRVGGHVYPRG